MGGMLVLVLHRRCGGRRQRRRRRCASVKEAYGGGEAIEGGNGWIDIWGRIEGVRLGGAMITHTIVSEVVVVTLSVWLSDRGRVLNLR